MSIHEGIQGGEDTAASPLLLSCLFLSGLGFLLSYTLWILQDCYLNHWIWRFVSGIASDWFMFAGRNVLRNARNIREGGGHDLQVSGFSSFHSRRHTRQNYDVDSPIFDISEKKIPGSTFSHLQSAFFGCFSFSERLRVEANISAFHVFSTELEIDTGGAGNRFLQDTDWKQKNEQRREGEREYRHHRLARTFYRQRLSLPYIASLATILFPLSK
jgi:hypothetical protein